MSAPGTCKRPPPGWYCSLPDGHCGPCPTYPMTTMTLDEYERALEKLQAVLFDPDEHPQDTVVAARRILRSIGFCP